MKKIFTQGIGLVEVLIAVSIITVGILALIASYNVYFRYALANAGNVQAAYLLEESLEAVSFIRDTGWSNISSLSTTTDYYVTFDTASSTWKATTTVEYVDGVFLRSFNLDDVWRDVNGEIVTSGGIYDPDTKSVMATINYFQGKATTTRTMTTYITNINED